MLPYFFAVCACVHLAQSYGHFYQAPTPKFEAFKPKGFRMTIPHEDGIEMVAFFVNLNKELDGTSGEYTKYIVRPTNGVWMYENTLLRLKMNDKVYVKILVLKDGVQYFYDRFDAFVVRDLVERTPIVHTPTIEKNSCQESLENITNTSLDLEEQLLDTKEDVTILKRIISRQPQTLQIHGIMAQGFTTKENLEFVLNKKLRLTNLKLKAAVKYPNYVEVTLQDVEDRLSVVRAAKRYLGGQSQQINVIY